MTAEYQRLKSRFQIKTFFDDDATAATARYIGWVEMGKHFVAQVAFGAGTGILTFKIFAASDSDGTDATVVLAHAAPTDADAANDRLTLEVSAEQVLAALATATHVSVELDNDANSDENAVTYIVEGGGNGGRFAYEDLTPDSEIAA